MVEPTGASACKHCFCVTDAIAGGLVCLAARDTSFAAVMHAPIAKIVAFKRRMKWDFAWVSSFVSDFNCNFHVTLDPAKGSTEYNYRPFDSYGELPGLSVFARDGGCALHSYSNCSCGLDMPPPRRHLLDRTPLGRQETKENSMAAGEASWIRLLDSYRPENDGGYACR